MSNVIGTELSQGTVNSKKNKTDEPIALSTPPSSRLSSISVVLATSPHPSSCNAPFRWLIQPPSSFVETKTLFKFICTYRGSERIEARRETIVGISIQQRMTMYSSRDMEGWDGEKESRRKGSKFQPSNIAHPDIHLQSIQIYLKLVKCASRERQLTHTVFEV